MSECSFCGYNIEKGTGKIFVLKSGKVFNFCSTKCEKNLMKLKRVPRLIKWTKLFEKGVKAKGQEKSTKVEKE